ncbi:MAG: TetR/AcrR family transcriptional regulator [Candidatus Dormibacteraeota bacterium]|nr:TetR/AcrR family transcriptional regulator [Candidatus Dormibacteraeota bacterium]
MSFPTQYRRTVTDRTSAAGDQSRERLLVVALDLFAAGGYRGTSIAQIAERAGLSQSGLLHHFPSKADLLAAALDHRDEVEGHLLEAADGEPAMGWAAFEALVELVRRNAAEPRLVRLFVTLSAEAIDPDHPAHRWMVAHYEGVSAWLTAAIERGKRTGEMDHRMPTRAVVQRTIATMDGLQILWFARGADVDMAVDFGEYVDELRHRWATAITEAAG